MLQSFSMLSRRRGRVVRLTFVVMDLDRGLFAIPSTLGTSGARDDAASRLRATDFRAVRRYDGSTAVYRLCGAIPLWAILFLRIARIERGVFGAVNRHTRIDRRRARYAMIL